MFRKTRSQNVNAIEVVAPTGFEPVFGRGHVFARIDGRLPHPLRSDAPHDSNTEGRSRAPDSDAHYLAEEPPDANTRPEGPPSSAARK
jgi:hypothetical protein